MESQPHYGPPEANVKTWVVRGNPGSLLTGKGRTPDVAHWDGSRDFDADVAWIREYAAGKDEFQGVWSERAHNYAESGDHTAAIVATRLVLEVPYQGDTWTFRSGPVEAMELADPIDDTENASSGHKLSQDEMTKKLEESLAVGLHAHEMAFGLPRETRLKLEEIASRSRAHLPHQPGDVVKAWSDTSRAFEADGETHAAGVAQIEQGDFYMGRRHPSDALIVYQAAVGLLKRRSEEIERRNQFVRDTAEMQELSTQAGKPLAEIINIYDSRGLIAPEDKGIIKSVINDLLEVSGEAQLMADMHSRAINMINPDMLDQGSITEALFKGYKMLADVSRFKQRRICKRAMKIIEDRRSDHQLWQGVQNGDFGGFWGSVHASDPLPGFEI